MPRKLTSRAAAMVARLVIPTTIVTAAPFAVGAWTAAQAATLHSCDRELCMDLKESSGDKRVVRFSADNAQIALNHVSHFNIRYGIGPQFEICGTCSWSFSVKGGGSYGFLVQACQRRPLASSLCTPWSSFHYTPAKADIQTKKEPVIEAPQVVPLPSKGKKGPSDYAVKEVEAVPDKGKGADAYVLKDKVGKQGADLAVVDLSGPPTLQAGLSGTYTVTIKNKGDVSAPVELHIIFAKALDQTGQIVTGAGLSCAIGHDAGINTGLNCTGGVLAAGDAATVVVQGRGQSTGGGVLLATLNPGHAVQESNYDNNNKQLNVTIN